MICLIVGLVWCVAGCALHSTPHFRTTIIPQGQQPPLSLSVEARLPRTAIITWHSVLRYDSGSERVAVLYSVPVIDGNGSFTYLELFSVPDTGPAVPEDRIFLGSRDGYAIDTISENDNIITLHAREHQYPDCIAKPTRHVNILVEWGHGVVRVSTLYPDAQTVKDKGQKAPTSRPKGSSQKFAP